MNDNFFNDKSEFELIIICQYDSVHLSPLLPFIIWIWEMCEILENYLENLSKFL